MATNTTKRTVASVYIQEPVLLGYGAYLTREFSLDPYRTDGFPTLP
jgi:hypothetical protein